MEYKADASIIWQIQWSPVNAICSSVGQLEQRREHKQINCVSLQ